MNHKAPYEDDLIDKALCVRLGLIAILTFIIGVISGAVLLAAIAILAAHDSMSDTPKSKEEWKEG